MKVKRRILLPFRTLHTIYLMQEGKAHILCLFMNSLCIPQEALRRLVTKVTRTGEQEERDLELGL